MESRQSDRVREKEGMRRSAACPDGNPYRSVESKVAGANSAAVYMPPRHRGPAWAEGEVTEAARLNHFAGLCACPCPPAPSVRTEPTSSHPPHPRLRQDTRGHPAPPRSQ